MYKYLFSILLIASSLNIMAADYYLDPDKSVVGFEIIKFKIGAPVQGSFKNFKASFKYDEESNELKSLNVEIASKSIFTNEPKRDQHLRTKDFFYVERFKNLTYKFNGPVKINDSFKVKGKFTLRGVTKDVVLNVEISKRADEKVIFTATTTINRLDYGVSWNATLEKSEWKKIFGIFAKTVLDTNVKIKIDGIAVKK